MERNHQVFKTTWNAPHLEDGHGGKFVTYPCTGLHTEDTATVLAATYTALCGGKGATYEAKKARA